MYTVVSGDVKEQGGTRLSFLVDQFDLLIRLDLPLKRLVGAGVSIVFVLAAFALDRRA